MWKMSLPPEVVVSIASVRLRNPMPFSCRPVMVSMRCVRDRPSRDFSYAGGASGLRI